MLRVAVSSSQMDAETVARSEEELLQVARRFARTLCAGDAVAIHGPLGAGKTTFVRGIASELLGEDPVTSPTFTFWHEYPGTPRIRHLDLYRIEDPAELSELGLEEAFTPEALVLVEWPERAPGMIPPSARQVTIEGAGDEPRTIRIG